MPLSPSGKYTPLDNNVDQSATESACSDTQNYYYVKASGVSDYGGIPQTGYVSGFQGIFPQYSGLAGSNQNTSARSIIPEDSARNLFQTLYDVLVFATHEDRQKAVQMLLAVYDL